MLLILIAKLTWLVSLIRKTDWSVCLSVYRLCLSCCLIHLGIQMPACRCVSQTTFPSLFPWCSLSLCASDNLTTKTHTHWCVLCIRSFSRCLPRFLLTVDVLTTLTLALPLSFLSYSRLNRNRLQVLPELLFQSTTKLSRL